MLWNDQGSRGPAAGCDPREAGPNSLINCRVKNRPHSWSQGNSAVRLAVLFAKAEPLRDDRMARIFSVGQALIAHRATARQQFSMFAEYKYPDCLVLDTVTAEFIGDNRGMALSLTQRRKLFTEIIGQRRATVLRLEEMK
jgi:hypothetical protein